MFGKDVKRVSESQNLITLCYAGIVEHCLNIIIQFYSFLPSCMYATISCTPKKRFLRMSLNVLKLRFTIIWRNPMLL